MKHLVHTFVLPTILVGISAGETAPLECIADVSIPIDSKQTRYNDGSTRVLELRGDGSQVLLRFRSSVIDGWRVTKATLWLHREAGPVPLRLSVSTVPKSWSESEATRSQPRRDETWAGEGSSIEDVVFGRGKSRHEMFDVREQPGGWITIEMNAAIVQPLANGESAGLALRGVDAVTRGFHSRETIQFSPYLIVEGSRQ